MNDIISILVVYGTGEGQTARIADRIVSTLDDLRYSAAAVDVSDLPTEFTLEEYDAVLVGTSIHAGRPDGDVVAFVEDNRETIERLPNGFFEVSLSAALDDEQSKAQAAQYVEEFIEKTGWHPDRIGVFGGALRYSEYGFLKRLLIKQIAKDTTGDTDTARDYEYTDWEAVEAFTEDFVAFVADELGTGEEQAA